MPIEAMAPDSAQWYAIPRTHTTLSSSVQQTAGSFEQPSLTAAFRLPGSVAPFHSCFPHVLDSNANNAAHSVDLALISVNNCMNAEANALGIPSSQDSMQHSTCVGAAHADCMDCSAVNPTSSSIAYALQLLGASRTSSCSNQTAWDDDDDGEGSFKASSQTCASLTSIAAADHTIAPDTPRLSSMARSCPAAPSRRGPSVKLVPAFDLMEAF